MYSLSNPVKFEGTSPVEQIFGAGLQGAGQGFGGAMGLMASNISGMVGQQTKRYLALEKERLAATLLTMQSKYTLHQRILLSIPLR